MVRKVVAKPKTVWVNFKMSKKLRDDARKKSRDTGIAVSFVVRNALQSWVDEKKGSQS